MHTKFQVSAIARNAQNGTNGNYSFLVMGYLKPLEKYQPSPSKKYPNLQEKHHSKESYKFNVQ